MGCTKGDLVVGGRRLAERAASVLWPFCGSVLVSIGRGGANPAPGYPAVEDAPPGGCGPLGGIRAAFDASGRSDLLVLACDYPRVGPDLLRRLLAFAQADDDLVMLSDAGGRDHPLVALWSRRMAAPVRDALDRGIHRVGALLGACNLRRVGPAELPGVDLNRALANVNWPADLERL
jgi:molybdopterin-guanine dinucleotide biosynthesis protein A